MTDYAQFIASKHRLVAPTGFDADAFTAPLFPFQQALVRWACERGRAAIFADTGLGKTAMQLEWAHQVVLKTQRPVVIIAPLGVTAQTVDEAEKFGIPNTRVIKMENDIRIGINVINFDRATDMDMTDLGGVVLDESSILKNALGKTRNALIKSAACVPYRLACTATPAPNDHTELGNHAEFLGIMEYTVMRSMFFINDPGQTIDPWRLKGHAVADFWRWVASWARCVTKPSDVGDFDDEPYQLPPLELHRLDVPVDVTQGRGAELFRNATFSATSLHAEKRRPADARAGVVAAQVAAEPDQMWIIWCDTDYDVEAIMPLLPVDAVEVSGGQTPEKKAKLLRDFARGEIRVLVTKPKIAGFGMNFQRCARMAMVGVSYEWESFYQRIRRIWRFGQTRECHVFCAVASTEGKVWASLTRKADNNEDLRSEMLIASPAAALSHDARRPYTPNKLAPIPAWLVTK